MSLSLPLFAAALQINPVNIAFEKDQSIQTLKITNQDQSDVILQLDLKAWRQNQQGEDLYSATTDFLVTPPLFTVPAGQTQLVRLAMVKPVNRVNESAYRLLIREVNPITQETKMNHFLRITLQTLLPVFVKPYKEDELDNYSATLALLPQGKRSIKITNHGSSHFLVTGLSITDKQHDCIVDEKPLFAYVLPGATQIINLKTDQFIPEDAIISLQTYR